MNRSGIPEFLYSSGPLNENAWPVVEEIKAPVQKAANPQEGIEKFKKLAEYLSTLILENNIPIIKGKEIVLSAIKKLENTQTISPDFLRLLHKLACHRAKPRYEILGNCKEPHCAECIRDFYFNLDKCQHDKRTYEGEKGKISIKITELNDAMKTCPICNETQDDIEFSAIRSEGCNVCDSCIVKYVKNNLRDFYNLKCPREGCENRYTLEQRMDLRDLLNYLGVAIPPPEGKDFKCIICESTANLADLCEMGCLRCDNCAKDLRDRNVDICPKCQSKASP